MRLRYALTPLSLLALLSQVAAADVITDWNSTAVDVVRRLEPESNRGTRALAIVELAAYDAVVSVTRGHAPYLAYVPVSSNAVSLEAAAATAVHDALLALYPSEAANLEQKLSAGLADIPDGEAKDNGVALGHRAALDIGFERLDDGSALTLSYAPAFEIGRWLPTPPGSAPALEPQWQFVRPFGIETASAFRSGEPPAIDSGDYAEAFNEVKALGSKASSTRSAEQTEIAEFWARAPQVPLNAIARTLSAKAGLSLEENARLFALLNVALADSRIAV